MEMRAAAGPLSAVAPLAAAEEPTGPAVDAAPWLAALGGGRNVLEAGAASSRVWLRLCDIAQVDEDALAKLGVRMVARPASDTLHLIVGDAAPIAAALQAA
jgi:phosphotransferase system IIB component